MRFVVSAVALVSLVGCSSRSPQSTISTPQTPPPLDPWVITNLDANLETPALLWNGLVGVRFGRDNKLFDIGHYERDGEEKILSEAGFLDLLVLIGEEPLGPVSFGDYASSLNMKTGVVAESWSQDVQSGGKVRVTVETVVHPEKRAFGQRWSIDHPTAAKIHVRSFESSANPTVDRAGWRWFLKDQLTSAASPAPGSTITRTAQTGTGMRMAFEEIVKASRDYWAKAWQTDIEIEGPVEDQQFIRSALFYLRSAIHPEGNMSISPLGLSSDIYNGHVFWDADIWVFPALALIDPERASRIPEYRLERLAQAKDNYVDWIVAGSPVGNGKLLAKPLSRADLAKMDMVVAAKFPWESSVSGKETVPGPSRYQDHISGSVAWSVHQAASLGLVDTGHAEALKGLVASFYKIRSTAGSAKEIVATMSPDEHHTGDNDLYTNLLAMWCENDGKWPARPTYKLPADDKSFLTYDNDPIRGYKQAAAVLSIYPLQYPPAEKQARQMMERFADKVTKNGPAMTDSIHSIIWARLGEKDKAYKAWHDSWKPFVKPPFLLFSEKRNSSRTYFTTGAAGSLQAVLYGFAGLRIDNKKAPDAQWSMPLKGGQILSVAPNLPTEWKKLTLRNLTILGKKYTFEIGGDKVHVTEEKQ